MLRTISPMFDPASKQAAAITDVFAITLIVCGIIFAIVAILVVTCLVKFRHRPGAGDPPAYFGNRTVELIWTAIPALIVFGLFILTARGVHLSDPPNTDHPDLVVISHQWWWEARYPNSPAIVANEIHIPVGTNWLVRLESADVIHDFWVPRLGRKIDVIPGRTNFVWISAAAPGQYDGLCAEYCGSQHAWMRFTVQADAPEQYSAWLHSEENSATPPATPALQRGLKAYQDKTCVNCHAIRGVSEIATAAPDLTHLASRRLMGGGILAITETNLFRWLKNPQAIKPACLMPNLNLSDSDASALAEYLATLK